VADVNYIAHAGGGEAIATLLSGSATMGISGISEVKPQIDSGALRPIAVSSAERVDLLPDVPTLKEEGVDVEITNWRGIVAPPGISADEEQALEDLVTDMTKTDEWQSALEAEGWGDVLQCGPEFEDFVVSETERTDQIVDELGIGEVS
jgi:putative tricarboxylic transport membrane protein